MGKLDGKVAVITGASRGIGKDIAGLFAAEGAKVVCASRSINEGDSFLPGSNGTTVAEIRTAGGTAMAVRLDVTDEASCRDAVEEVRKAFGPVDILVNNAVDAYMVKIEDITSQEWLHTFDTALNGPFRMIRQVLPDMIARHGGSIINITSPAAIGPGRGPYKTSGMAGTAYGASKAALERLTQGLAEEVYQYGISVTAFAPSQGVATPTMVHNTHCNPDDPRFEPVEMMSRAALLLATEPLDKVTGRVTYCQAILEEFGWISGARGVGIDEPGSGYSLI
ncbi:MAG: SDR family NAD(P)-dependent oxidoreductase [Clostridiales bacterium]|nr:SDR family NAD(P)-dependent oxidoreductase [Clostridiales bacterium]